MEKSSHLATGTRIINLLQLKITVSEKRKKKRWINQSETCVGLNGYTLNKEIHHQKLKNDVIIET